MSIERQIKQFIVSNYLFTEDDSAIGNEDSLVNSGIIDSTGVLELITHVEDTYGIEVLAEEMVPENFDSVRRVVEFVLQKKRAG